MELALWISIAIVFYTLIGYGLVITLLANSSRKNKVQELANEDLPIVTLLIAAYNEEDIIEAKIKNSLDLDYPKDKINFVLVTDGSDDKTNLIVKKFKAFRLFHKSERLGKIAAINRVMPMIHTPITIFSDANVMINSKGLRALVKHFQNNLTSAVSGEKKIIQKAKDGASASGEGFYWKYESFLKRKDAEWNSLVGSAGELFAIRTHLYQKIDENTIIEDFVMTMKMASEGYQVAYEPQAIATETASVNTKEEMKRKVRIAAGGAQAIMNLPGLFNFMRHGKLTFQYFSHRFLRWTFMPIAFALTFFLSYLLSEDQWYYDLLFKVQIAFYILALIGYVLRNKNTSLKVVYIPYYFTVMHICLIRGWIRYFLGNQKVTWEKAQRA